MWGKFIKLNPYINILFFFSNVEHMGNNIVAPMVAIVAFSEDVPSFGIFIIIAGIKVVPNNILEITLLVK